MLSSKLPAFLLSPAPTSGEVAAPTLESFKAIVSADHPEGLKRKKDDDDDEEALPKKLKTGGRALAPSSSFFRAFTEAHEQHENQEKNKETSPYEEFNRRLRSETADGLGIEVPLAPVVQGRTLDPPVIQEGGKHVLVVDDSLSTRRFLQRVFENNGYRVDVCHNGWQAFAQMQSRLYDFVFLDIEMPVMNGYRCAQAIRKWEQHVGRKNQQIICALTSHTEQHERDLGRDIGMNFFESKPARPKRLLDIVDQVLKCANGDASAAAALAVIATAHSCGHLDELDNDNQDNQHDDNKEAPLLQKEQEEGKQQVLVPGFLATQEETQQALTTITTTTTTEASASAEQQQQPPTNDDKKDLKDLEQKDKDLKNNNK